MVAVLTDIIKIIVLAACANALLRIGGALELGKVRLRIYSAEEDGLVLVHTSVGKEERRVVVRDNRRRGN